MSKLSMTEVETVLNYPDKTSNQLDLASCQIWSTSSIKVMSNYNGDLFSC